MKSLLFFLPALTIASIFGLSPQAKAYNLKACNDAPFKKTDVINLLQPVDQKMINCIPELNSTASKWKSKANKINSVIGKLQIGNNGKSKIERLEYRPSGNSIFLVALAKAAHTWKIKECILPRIVINKWGLPKQDGCEKWVDKSISASTTCNYEYTYYISSKQSKPVFKCGKGALGSVKLDASAVNNILQGEMPTLGQILNAVDLTPPGFQDKSSDEYDNIRTKMLSNHSTSKVYFSSRSFVEWAATDTQAANLGASIVTFGAYTAKLKQELIKQLSGEIKNIGIELGVQLATDQIISMMENRGVIKVDGFDVSVKVVSVPKYMQKCMVKPRKDCLPRIQIPRAGYAIIVTPNVTSSNNQSSSTKPPSPSPTSVSSNFIRSKNSNLCFDLSENKDGGIVVASSCFNVLSTFQSWSFQGNSIKNLKSGKCLDVSNNKKFGSVVVASCFDNPDNTFQSWFVTDAGLIKNIKSGLCLDIKTDNPKFLKIVLNDCVPDGYRTWKISPN